MYKRGFTLIELLVVISIIGLLSGIVMISVNESRSKARDSVRKQQLKQISLATKLYIQDHGHPPELEDGLCATQFAPSKVEKNPASYCFAISTAGVGTRENDAWKKFEKELEPYLKTELPDGDCGLTCVNDFTYVAPLAMQYACQQSNSCPDLSTYGGDEVWWQLYTNLEGNEDPFSWELVDRFVTQDMFLENSPLAAPVNFSVQSLSKNDIPPGTYAKFSASFGDPRLTGYTLYLNGVYKGSTSGTQIEAIGLTPNTLYTAHIIGFDNTSLVSSPSPSITFTTPPANSTVLPIPTEFTVVEARVTDVTFSAVFSSPLVGYKLYINGSYVNTTDTSEITVNNLTHSTAYTAYVIGVDASGNVSSRTNILNFSTTAEPLPPVELVPPSNFSVDANSTDATFNAEFSNPLVGYKLYINGSYVNTTNTSEITVNNLTHSTAYTAYAIGIDASGNESAQTNTLNFSTKSLQALARPSIPPPYTGITDSGNSSIRVRVNAPADTTDISGYDVYVQGALRASVSGSESFYSPAISVTCTSGNGFSSNQNAYAKSRSLDGRQSAPSATALFYSQCGGSTIQVR